MGLNMRSILFQIFLVTIVSCSPGLLGQEPEKPVVEKEGEPVRGGVVYEPIQDDGGKLRDPFKSPFEIEEEAEEAPLAKGLDEKDRLPFTVSVLNLKGIYLQAKTGYWAIFEIGGGGDYRWFQVGTRFQDGDLVNIADGAVVFKHYISEDATQVREVIKELHRGEE